MDTNSSHHLHTFDSGLRLVTVPMQGTKTVTVFVLVGTGSKYETKDINGISHFLEHMMFKGTTKRPGYLDISRELESIGASFNAFTSKEYTGYYAKASSSKADVIMDVIFDIFLNSTLEEAAIQTERHVVVEEIAMYNDNPQYLVGRDFETLLYADQPAGWEVAGEKETILGLKREQFVGYFKTHYVAGNTVVAVAGDINEEEIQKKVAKAFEHIRTAPKFEKQKVIETQTAPALHVFFKDTDQAHLVLGFRSHDMFDEWRYAMDVLADILGGGLSSRLFDEVREKRGLAYYVSAGQDSYTDSGYFAVSAGVNIGKVPEAISAILAELKKVAEKGVTEVELTQAKNKAEGRTAMALEKSDFIANTSASSLLFRNVLLTAEEELAKIKAVTLEDVAEVAKDVFQESKLNLAIVGPFKDAEPFKKLLTL